LLNLAGLLMEQHTATGDPEPRAEGLATVDRALRTVPAASAARVALLASRSALLLSALAVGDADPRSTLDEAIATLEEAAGSVPDGYLDAPGVYFNLGMALSRRGELRAEQGDLPGARADVDGAVEQVHEAIGLCAARPEMRSRLQGALAITLLRRAGLVQGRRNGKHVHYRLAGEKTVIDLLSALSRVGDSSRQRSPGAPRWANPKPKLPRPLTGMVRVARPGVAPSPIGSTATLPSRCDHTTVRRIERA